MCRGMSSSDHSLRQRQLGVVETGDYSYVKNIVDDNPEMLSKLHDLIVIEGS